MAKEVGAKGVIITNKDIDDAMDPYGDFSDATFLVFIAQSEFADDLLLGTSFFVGSLSSTSDIASEIEAQLWISALNEKSYELVQYWQETLKEIPAIAQKVNWKPRYAMWGCFTGSSFSDSCTTDA